MSATLPARLPAGRAAQASATEAEVPVRARGYVPDAGGPGAPVAALKPNAWLSGVAVNANWLVCVLSNDATPMTFLPTPGALAEYRQHAGWPCPALPIEATTTTPFWTRRSLAVEVG